MYTKSEHVRRKRVDEMRGLRTIVECKLIDRLQEEGKEQNYMYKAFVT
jgi:hypothetical protein